ncbi:hypothetical protein V5O48_002941 [Marasmius crinis-equi]|uniref:J domain-containing protein n=1 Tax=Marasmius crinis-equi TaxID=585013 RepID=A0ABR3FV00_9AGAR
MDPSPAPGVRQPHHLPQPPNWYKVLGVRNDATKEDIKLAYKKLASVWHPDRHVDDKNLATTKFAEINNAYRAIMLDRHLLAVHKAREEAINPHIPVLSETRPPVFSRPTFSTFSSRRSSSSTTLGSLNSSSRQSSFESVSTPPSTPRFISRSASRSADGNCTSYFDRPISLPVRTYTITPPAQSIEVTLSDLNPPTPITPITPTSPRLGEFGMSQIPENTLPPESAQDGGNAPPSPSPAPSAQTQQSVRDDSPQIFPPEKPQPPRAMRKGETIPKGFPHLTPIGLGTSREWKYSLLLTLEELFLGKNCRLHIVRCLLDGTKVNVTLEVNILPGTLPGTRYLFKGVGHERPDHTFQDISFVIEQVAHERFTREEDDLIMKVQLPWNDMNGRICFTGIDGLPASVEIDRKNGTCAGDTVVFGAGMPKVHGNEVIGHGNLVIRYDILPISPAPAERTHSLTSWTFGPAPVSRWRAFKNALRFRK